MIIKKPFKYEFANLNHWSIILFLKRFFIVFLFTILFPFGVHGETKSPPQLHTIQFFFENDLFGNTDKYYTNAVQFTWISNDLKQYKDDVRLPEWVHPIIKIIPFSETPNSVHNVGILFGQHIYTPADIQETTLQDNDRAYAGFLYTGLALHSKTDEVLDTLEVVVGIVGPNAYAEFAQNTVHEIRDIPTAKGWEHQLANEPALQLSWQRKWRVVRGKRFNIIDYDFINHAGLTLGNVRIAGTTGAEARLGYNLPLDFGSDLIQAGAGISTPAISKKKTGKRSFGSHLFSSAQLEIVGHDIFLDGNTFTGSPHVEKELVVATISAGVAFNFDRYKLTYRHLYRTKQFDNQKQDQIIGSMTLGISF